MTSPALQVERWRPRRTWLLGVHDRADWRIKVIGITADGGPLSGDETEAALRVAESRLPQPAWSPTRSAAGFVIVHRGADALWVLVCWWEIDLLYERLWRADLGTTDLRPVPSDGPTACVWELQAIDHERRAWVEHVLRRPSAPDYAGYLASRMDDPGATG